MNKYNELGKTVANYATLSPVSFLRRSATVYPEKTAVIDDDMTLSYRQLLERSTRLASALANAGIGHDDTVAMLCPNSHEMLEAHYGVPMGGAVLNTLNIRLDAATLGFILNHGEARVLMYDTEFEPVVQETLASVDHQPLLIAIERDAGPTSGLAGQSYEALLAAGDPDAEWAGPRDEWDAISLNYTSGTTGNPKGVVYHHRGAYLAAMSDAMAFNMNDQTVYLWTLPMFHCNGWGYTWAITAVGGTHVCLRKVDADDIYQRIERYGVTHMCGAPIVLNMVLTELGRQGKRLSSPAQFALGGAAPPSAVIRKAEEIGFVITHLYGLTESYGPASLCVPQPEWADLPLEQKAVKMSRQGVQTLSVDEITVLDRATGEPVPHDGATLGEICIRGNTVMKGYLKNPDATEKAFHRGWFNSGDLAVVHPDNYIEIRDRAKDIIISGGENISSLEVEEALYLHPEVSEAAVVAMADEKWGEVPCAFVSPVNDDGSLTEDALIAHCREKLARFKVPKRVVIGELPKTATGKIRKNLLREQLGD
ncbi:long-chain-fatty-acid--CoA ligase [Marinobacter bryozoorum]|uniref:long-chain-fatty-acid--CoA ligase n=1 Tax=Marinobacter bryozoorum TaxID=256324 RepID=UPI00200661C4|nr:long-chain-fatty-acid--CoA ligase [Marinobacter bryozoorum]MCK7543570.1 long-chain-fatty-acid--CoA ligase [Marinobacter bryozoorum]